MIKAGPVFATEEWEMMYMENNKRDRKLTLIVDLKGSNVNNGKPSGPVTVPCHHLQTFLRNIFILISVYGRYIKYSRTLDKRVEIDRA